SLRSRICGFWRRTTLIIYTRPPPFIRSFSFGKAEEAIGNRIIKAWELWDAFEFANPFRRKAKFH
ncbi:MAG: hypothetical protein IKK12_04780, partial [Clostridia bacterium]|nr:hypothetical protein [Clostridia bacterium]